MLSCFSAAKDTASGETERPLRFIRTTPSLSATSRTGPGEQPAMPIFRNPVPVSRLRIRPALSVLKASAPLASSVSGARLPLSSHSSTPFFFRTLFASRDIC
ncbi:hypothetical protein D3C74_423900 [compost metagenome]